MFAADANIRAYICRVVFCTIILVFSCCQKNNKNWQRNNSCGFKRINLAKLFFRWGFHLFISFPEIIIWVMSLFFFSLYNVRIYKAFTNRRCSRTGKRCLSKYANIMINSIFVCTKLKVTAKARRQGQSHGFHSTIFFRFHGNNGRNWNTCWRIYESERKFPSRATFHLELKINFSSLLKNLLFLARSNPNHLKHIYLHPIPKSCGNGRKLVPSSFHVSCQPSSSSQMCMHDCRRKFSTAALSTALSSCVLQFVIVRWIESVP